MSAEEKRTYILNMKDGTKQKITVPSKWKLSFGPLVPGSKGGDYNRHDNLVLRLWEGNKDNQRAVFVGVESWRDTQELAIEVEQVEKRQQQVMVDVPGEGQKACIVEAELRKWVNPDVAVSPRSEFTQLPKTVLE